MNEQQARAEITADSVRSTVRILAALDSLQAATYTQEIEARVLKKVPHSESQMFEMAQRAVIDFIAMSMPGNAQGIRMNVSSFINNLQVCGLQSEMDIAIKAVEELD